MLLVQINMHFRVTLSPDTGTCIHHIVDIKQLSDEMMH